MGGLFKGSNHVFMRVSKKTTKNSKLLNRQAGPEIEPDSSRLPVLRAELLGHWWGHLRIKISHEAGCSASLVCGMHQIIGF